MSKFFTDNLKACDCKTIPLYYELVEGKFLVKCPKCSNSTQLKLFSNDAINAWNKKQIHKRNR